MTRLLRQTRQETPRPSRPCASRDACRRRCASGTGRSVAASRYLKRLARTSPGGGRCEGPRFAPRDGRIRPSSGTHSVARSVPPGSRFERSPSWKVPSVERPFPGSTPSRCVPIARRSPHGSRFRAPHHAETFETTTPCHVIAACRPQVVNNKCASERIKPPLATDNPERADLTATATQRGARVHSLVIERRGAPARAERRQNAPPDAESGL